MIHIFKSKIKLQDEWKNKTIDYAKSINTFINKGLQDGWDNAGPEPEDNKREKLVPYLLKAIRKANEDKEFTQLREDWPLAHSPLIPELDKNGQDIPVVAILDDGRIIARIGAPYEQGYVVEINDLDVSIIDGIDFFGRSPNKKYFAYTKEKGVSITDGWLGKETTFCPYPIGTEGIPSEFNVKPFENPPTPTQLIPFPDGTSVLFVSTEGIFVLKPTRAIRILPTKEDMKEHFAWQQEEYPEDDLQMDLSMEHGAVSTDGKLIAIGSQDSTHLVLNDAYQLIGDVGNQSEYPHYAIFSKDGDMIAFNSCHFYNGITIGVPTNLLPNLKTEPYEENDQTPILEDGARVYAGVYRKDEFIIGDANGNLRGVGKDGKLHWQHFIGSSIGDIAISEDERTLVCSTFAGFISIIDLDSGKMKEYEIGNGGHTELRRWLFWKEESQPLAW